VETECRTVGQMKLVSVVSRSVEMPLMSRPKPPLGRVFRAL
jgi:hypothetical protein